MEDTCLTCRHFRQHYVRSGKRFIPLLEGHCIHPRLKNRATETPACQHYSHKRETE